jgi:hypothetical protein
MYRFEKYEHTYVVLYNLEQKLSSLSGGSLTKIAYYSTVSYRRVFYEVERENGPSSSQINQDSDNVSPPFSKSYCCM